jgi:predicted nucleic-acid-binding protein
VIGLDTNILVRYFTQDDAGQAEKVSKFLKEKTARGESFFINSIVLCELIWVLEFAYDYPKSVIIGVVEKILATKQFEIEQSELVWAALEDFKKSKADFSDLLIGRKNGAANCEVTVSLDGGLRSVEGFQTL